MTRRVVAVVTGWCLAVNVAGVTVAALIGSDTVFTVTATDTATAALELGRHRITITETGDDHTYLAGWLEISRL